MSKQSVLLAPAFALALAVAGCSSTVTSGDATIASSVSASTTTASPTVTNTLPGPHPPPNDNNNGTGFDPCLAYTATELKNWGVAPGSVEDQGVGDGIQRGCLWHGDGWVLQQLVINQPVEQYLNSSSFSAEAITVGGLGAAMYRTPPGDPTSCSVELPAQKASVGTIVRVNDPQAKRAIPDACTKALTVATDTAKKLPK